MARSTLDAFLGRIQDDGSEIEIGSGLNFIGLTVALNAATGFIDVTNTASAPSSDDVSNESGVTGATVTEALDALEAEIVAVAGVPTTRTITAGAGLTGGGDLSANRTIDVAAGDATITVSANSIAVGTLTNANSPTNTLGLNKLVNAGAQFDIIGRKTTSAGAWEDCTRTELHLALDTVTLTAGAGLTGGGDLSTNRTFTVVANADGTITVNADDIQVGTLVAGNYASNTIALAKLTNATAQNRWIQRVSSSGGAWEEATGAQVLAGLSGGTIAALTATALTCTTINGTTVAAPTEGTALTNADQTLTVAGGNNYVQSTALTVSRTKTLGTTGSPETGEVITIYRSDAAAFTMPIVNGGGGGGTMYTFPVSVKRVVDFRYDGTNWVLAGVKRVT
jgi:hypothetical protein